MSRTVDDDENYTIIHTISKKKTIESLYVKREFVL